MPTEKIWFHVEAEIEYEKETGREHALEAVTSLVQPRGTGISGASAFDGGYKARIVKAERT